MSCRTLTYPTEALTIHVRSKEGTQTQVLFSSTYRWLLTELGKILVRHQNKKDTFSLKVLEQGKKIELFVSTSFEKPSQESFMAHIHELQSLLPNPFGNELAWDLLNLIHILPIPVSSHQRQGVMAHQVGVTTLVKEKRELTPARSRNREILGKCVSLIKTVALKRQRWEQALFATELGKIVLRHQDKKDTLSQRLFAQGEKFEIFTKITSEIPSNESFLAHVEELRELLRNPFTEKTILKDPWLVGDLVWEWSYLTVYCEALGFVVSDKVVKIPHEFARDVLTLLKSLPNQASDQMQGICMNQLGVLTFTLDEEMVPKRPRDKEHALKILLDFQYLMAGVEREREQWRINQFLTREIDFCTAEIDRRDAISGSQLATLSSSLDQVFTDVRDKVETLTQERQYEMNITKAQLNRTEERLKASEEDLAKANVAIENLKVAHHNLATAYSHLAGRCSWLEENYHNDSSCSLM